MSFVEFTQADERLLGLCAYEADPSWTLTPMTRDNDLIYPGVSTDEGDGSWFVLAPELRLWGTILRAGDTPYNDCLPPSETLLLKAFQQGTSAESVLKHLSQQVDGEFFNSFRAVVGDLPQNNLHRFHGSFQTDLTTADEGTYRLEDNEDLTRLDSSSLLPKIDSDAPLDQFRKTLSTETIEENLGDFLSKDGMRELARVTIFEWSNQGLETASLDPTREDPSWESNTFTS